MALWGSRKVITEDGWTGARRLSGYKYPPPSLAQPLVVTLFAPLAVLARPSTRRLLLAILLMDIPMQIGKHFGNRPEVVDWGGLGGLSVSVSTIALTLLYLSIVLQYIAAPYPYRLALRMNWPLTLYVGVVGISMAVARDATLTFFEFFLFAQLLLMFIFVANWVDTREEVVFFVRYLLLGLVFEGALMLFLAQRGSGFEFPGMHLRVDVDSGVSHLSRVAGTIGSPNGAGAYLTIVLSLAAAVLLSDIKGVTKRLAALGFVFGVPALVVTYSRGSFSGFALAFGLIFLLTALRRKVSWRWVAVIVLLMGVVLGTMRSSLATRVFGDDANSAYSRVPLARLAFSIIRDHPVLGVGSNNYTAVLDDYTTGEFRHEFLYTVHNRYLLIWSETGLLGLLIYLWFLLAILWRGWLCWKLRDPVLSPIALGFSAAIVAHMLQMTVDAYRGQVIPQLVWLAAALITVSYDIALKGRQGKGEGNGTLSHPNQP